MSGFLFIKSKKGKSMYIPSIMSIDSALKNFYENIEVGNSDYVIY